MVEISENQSLAPLTTFGIGGAARYFSIAHDENDVSDAVSWAKERGVPLFILGGGSNLLIRDTGFPGLVLHIDIRGIQQDKTWSPDFCVGAGEVWDSFVDVAIAGNCAGIECLAGIPGRVGGTPVQNVGAYGQEVSETIRQVRVFDTEASEFRWLSKEECKFRYRESVFNTTERGRYIVTAVVFLLNYRAPTLAYAEVQKRFEGRWRKPSLREVAETVREIRREKGMLIVDGDPDCQSAGSFFKNPIVTPDVLPRVAAAAGVLEETVPRWFAVSGLVKLPAAWLLEKSGFTKGFGTGPAAISSRHTLALINRGGATFADVERLQNKIIATVHEKFGITLEREPVLVG